MAITVGDPTSVGTLGFGTDIGDITATLVGSFGCIYSGEEDFYPGEPIEMIINRRQDIMARKNPAETIINRHASFVIK